MSNEGERLAIKMMLLVAVVSTVSGIVIGRNLTVHEVSDLKKQAISHGAAEYVLVNGGPETKFVWKEKP
jgi:cytochrome b subunit of formate dehydrogenase